MVGWFWVLLWKMVHWGREGQSEKRREKRGRREREEREGGRKEGAEDWTATASPVFFTCDPL